MKYRSRIIGIVVIAVVIIAAIGFSFFNPSGSNTADEPVLPPQDKSLLLYCGAGIQPVAEALIQADVCQELGRIQRTLGITTIHISHNQIETALLADRVGVLDQGCLMHVIAGDKVTS